MLPNPAEIPGRFYSCVSLQAEVPSCSVLGWQTYQEQREVQVADPTGLQPPAPTEDAIGESDLSNNMSPPRRTRRCIIMLAGIMARFCQEPVHAVSHSESHDGHATDNATTVRWRHLCQVEWHETNQHAQAKSVDDPDGQKHGNVWRACCPSSSNTRQQCRRR